MPNVPTRTKPIKTDITRKRMPDDLVAKLDKLSPLARKYCEFRAKGLSQADSAEKAGSKAKGRAALGRVGWNTEQQLGVKEYVLWLEHQRARASVIDDVEIAEKFRRVYDEAMLNNKFQDANKALEHLGNMVGAFANKGNTENQNNKDKQTKNTDKAAKNNTKAFTQDLDNHEIDERAIKLQRMLDAMKK